MGLTKEQSKDAARWAAWAKTEKGQASQAAYRRSEKGRAAAAARKKRRRLAGGSRGDIKSQRLRAKERLKLWLRDLKSTLSCIRCGFSHPAALHFHHEGVKNDEINNLVQKGRRAALLREISLCIVLCANCHSIFHYEEHKNPSEN